MSYCPRQCALIHLEGVFDENIFTLKGHQAHERVDQPEDRWERGRTIWRALPVWSEQYGLIGKCDAVEVRGKTLLPVEYKVGRAGPHLHATIQAVAQALCLEEMFETEVREIALYFIASHERRVVPIDEQLRIQTLRLINETRAMLRERVLPPPVADRRCRKCSLQDACQPFVLTASRNSSPDPFRLRTLGDL